MANKEFFSVYVTAASADEARRLASAAVEEKLAACANILGEMESIFFWEGRLQRERETGLLLKTTGRKLQRLMERLKQMHSYQVPCIVAWPIKDGCRAYLEWVEGECGGEET